MPQDEARKKSKKTEGNKDLDLVKDKNFAEAVKIMANTFPSSNEEIKRSKKHKS